MESAFQEALNLFLRWVHVLAAIMWIGDSFLFMWMDSHLETPSKPRDGAPGQVVGELWMTHSGGFYELVKRKFLSQSEMPKNLYWFKWESYTTWMTGFLLLFVVYYLNGASFLVDPTISAMGTASGILLSLALLLGGWIVYDVLWSTPLGKRPALLGPLCFVGLVAIAFAITQVYSGRAAYLHIGAMMGTIMSANVFFRIIPAQKYMLAQTRAGKPVDTSLGLRAKTRSRHNHYMTLPVLFCMLSNHFPQTFHAKAAWLILGIVFLFGAGLKYIMNYRGKAGFAVWLGTIVSFVLVLVLTTGRTIAVDNAAGDLMTKPATFPNVNRIIQARCVPCHATIPTNAGFKSPPAGVVLEDPAQIAKLAPRILYQVWTTRAMPLGNLTGIVDDERATIAAWVKQGAKVTAAPRWEDAKPSEAAVREAAEVYASRCVVCHGKVGAGDGPAAKGMVPRPSNLRDRAWHTMTSDEELRKVVLEGGPAVGKAGTMPPSHDLEDKPEVLIALVQLMRGFEDAPKPGTQALEPEPSYIPLPPPRPKHTLPPEP
ncbi:MAG: urate hydroxylase PuuD [Myxococcota bacterium]